MSVDTLDKRRTRANGSARPTGGLLAHIPGDDGWPFVGHTLAIVADYRGFVERRVQRYGMVHRGRAFGHANVTMLGPEANELVFLDPQKQFSSALGWGIVLDKLFPRGLMLLDFDEHRVHRRALSVAFKADPMRSYLADLNAGIAKGLAQWPRRRGFKFYPAIKQLTLDLAATSFLGGELGPELEAVKRAFIAMVAASIAVIRAPLPGTGCGRGVRGRAHPRRLFQPANPAAARAGRRRPVLAAMPRHLGGRHVPVDCRHRRPHELSHDGGARHADLLAHRVRRSARGRSRLAGEAPRRASRPRPRRQASPCRSSASTISRSPRWRSRKRCG